MPSFGDGVAWSDVTVTADDLAEILTTPDLARSACSGLKADGASISGSWSTPAPTCSSTARRCWPTEPLIDSFRYDALEGDAPGSTVSGRPNRWRSK